MQKEPAEIGMREIEANCGVSATSIYHYYKDKELLFQEIALDCLEGAAEIADSPKQKVLDSIRAFRGWCLKNPRVALLVMEKIKSAENLSAEETEKFYVCNRTGERLLELCIAEGSAQSENPRLDIGVLVFGLWGLPSVGYFAQGGNGILGKFRAVHGTIYKYVGGKYFCEINGEKNE